MTLSHEEREIYQATLTNRWYAEGYYSDQTFGEELKLAAQKFPDSGFVFASESGRRRINFPEVLDLSGRAAGGLQSLGVRPGDTVAIQVSNRPELVIAYYAAFLAGAIVVPITHIYGPGEMSFILKESRAKVLIVPDVWRSINYVDRVNNLADTPDLEHVIMIGEGSVGNSTSWDELMRHAPGEPVAVSADDVCTIIYTSGTTSSPKGVQHTHNTLLAEMHTAAPMMAIHQGETKLVPWPAGHVAGLIGICAGIVSGINVVLMDRWDVDLAVQLIEEFHCVVGSGTPLHIAAILDAAASTSRDVSALRYMQVGGANVPPELVQRAERAGLSIARAYGSTEHPTSAFSSPDAPADKRSTTDGHPCFGDEIQIVDDFGLPLPTGSEGEIVTRGPTQFVGYRDQELNIESFLPGGWFLTGDIGRLDEDGYLTVTDRRKDIIIRGGENIASKEVEDILAKHPRVLEAAVVAEPDPKYGERVAAFVLLNEGDSLGLDEVCALFEEAGVARQKTPERVIVTKELPRTPSGKVQKFALRDLLREEARATSS